MCMLSLLFYHTHTYGLNPLSLGPAPTLSPYWTSQIRRYWNHHAKHRRRRGSVYLHGRFDLRMNYQWRISTDQLNGRHRYTVTEQTTLKLQSLPASARRTHLMTKKTIYRVNPSIESNTACKSTGKLCESRVSVICINGTIKCQLNFELSLHDHWRIYCREEIRITESGYNDHTLLEHVVN